MFRTPTPMKTVKLAQNCPNTLCVQHTHSFQHQTTSSSTSLLCSEATRITVFRITSFIFVRLSRKPSFRFCFRNEKCARLSHTEKPRSLIRFNCQVIASFVRLPANGDASHSRFLVEFRCQTCTDCYRE